MGGNPLAQALEQIMGLGSRGGHEQREFIAAEASHQITAAHRPVEEISHPPNHLIPRGVAVVVYDLDGDAPAAWEAAWHAWHDLNAARALWNVEGLADPDDRRAHGDAERPTHRSRTRVIGRPPRWLRANTSLLSLGAGRQTLIPTPDALLVAEPGGAVGAVPWHAVRVDAFAERVREPGPVPADAEVVGTTWQHARKDGGRDRRFRDNPEIAICRYGVLHLHSASGLDERFHVSDPRRAEAVRDAIAGLRAAIDPGRP